MSENSEANACRKCPPEGEYLKLTNEILQYQKFRNQILLLALTLFSALLAIPPGASYSFLHEPLARIILLGYSSVAYVVICLASSFNARLSRRITYMGAYLAVFHEKADSKMGWELAKYLSDEKEPKGKTDKSTRTDYGRIFFFSGLVILCYSCILAITLRIPFFEYFFGSNSKYPNWPIIVVLLIIYGGLFLHLWKWVLKKHSSSATFKSKTEYFNHWLQISGEVK